MNIPAYKPLMALGLVLTALAFDPTAQAGDRGYRETGDYYDYAKVVRVQPIVRHVRVTVPREECWDEEVPVYHSGYRSATPMILGGIIGGVLGNQVGKGRGNDVATVAGTVLGGSIGRDVGYRNSPPDGYSTVVETRCRQVADYREEERIEGYDVTYRYQGQDYVTRMPHDPGDRIRVRVAVEPAW